MLRQVWGNPGFGSLPVRRTAGPEVSPRFSPPQLHVSLWGAFFVVRSNFLRPQESVAPGNLVRESWVGEPIRRRPGPEATPSQAEAISPAVDAWRACSGYHQRRSAAIPQLISGVPSSLERLLDVAQAVGDTGGYCWNRGWLPANPRRANGHPVRFGVSSPMQEEERGTDGQKEASP